MALTPLTGKCPTPPSWVAPFSPVGVSEAVVALMTASQSVFPKTVPDVLNAHDPYTSQLPAVKLTLVTLAAVLEVRDPVVAVALISSPRYPAGGAVLVFLPRYCPPVGVQTA